MTQLGVVRSGDDWTFQYNYPATANNGRISSRWESQGNETITYEYDELNRLTKAEAVASYWGYGQRFVYDGFGNLTDKQITRGWVPTLSVAIDKSKNRIASSPYVYDANGSVTQQPGYGGCGTATLAWDTLNRMTSIAAGGCGSEYYKYGPDGLRAGPRGQGDGVKGRRRATGSRVGDGVKGDGVKRRRGQRPLPLFIRAPFDYRSGLEAVENPGGLFFRQKSSKTSTPELSKSPDQQADVKPGPAKSLSHALSESPDS